MATTEDISTQQTDEKSDDLVLTTINGYLSSKKYILDKMHYSLNTINDQGKYIHSNKPPEKFIDYLKFYYYKNDSKTQIKGLSNNSALYDVVRQYVEKEDTTDSQINYNKKPDVFFISDSKAAYIGESEPTGANIGKNYNINYISLGFLIDNILNANIGIKMRVGKGKNEDYVDVFNFVETPIKIVNSPYLISKNYSVCLIPQLHPYSDGTPGNIKKSTQKIDKDGADPNDSGNSNGSIAELIYDKDSRGMKLWGWKNTIWNMDIEIDDITKNKKFAQQAGNVENDYVDLRYLLLNEQWIVKLFNGGSDLGKVLENIVNEIQSAVFGWWQLMLVADNVNNNIKIIDTRGDIKDRIEEEIFKFEMYEEIGTNGEIAYNSIIRDVNIETQMSNTFAISAMYKQNESEEDKKENYAFNLANSSFNNMWNMNDKNKYSDIFLNNVIIQKVDYNKYSDSATEGVTDEELINFYEKGPKSTFVAEDK